VVRKMATVDTHGEAPARATLPLNIPAFNSSSLRYNKYRATSELEVPAPRRPRHIVKRASSPV
jgi:hypothetical protein